ncbi:MAG TPA: BF3164 family lipoprotein [Cyclobacteriaceae bacterium]|nr:BF3164 family lipoprotein [Cyclobacteriaceae bacterium]
MKKSLLILSFFIFTYCLSGCDGGFTQVDQKFTRNSFIEQRTLSGTKLDLGTVLAPIQIFFYDSLLFISAEGLDKVVSVYNRNNNYKMIGGIISRGMGPDELTSVARMDFNPDKTFWAHDIVAGQLKKFELVITPDTSFVIANGHEQLRYPVMNAFLVKSGMIGTTTQDIMPLKRFYIYDSLGNRKEAGDYPKYKREIPPTALVEVFNGWASLKPSKDRFVLGYEYTDLIEIYNGEFELIKRIQGPDNFLPEFDLKQRGNSIAMMRRYDKTKYAYQAVASSDSLIFLLYDNGETISKDEDQDEASQFKTIVVIDWEGRPLSLYQLDHSIISVCVDWHRRVIYGLDRIESEVYAFPF